MTTLPEKIVELHVALDRAELAHAFGGALALAWCTERARGTIDIDLNVFVGVKELERVLAALPDPIDPTDEQHSLLERDGQARLWWDTTPVDLFLNTTDFHAAAARRCRWEEFLGTSIPFLSCDDLAVFKAFFDRTKDWADLEEMRAADSLDVDRVVGVLVRHLGPDDHRVERILQL
ncbi:MAG TPA: hypothetical protein VJM33_13160 [Microthrixaceae bacterium]|nr:hypothetical protein [Microthrixaceae bacterium]